MMNKSKLNQVIGVQQNNYQRLLMLRNVRNSLKRGIINVSEEIHQKQYESELTFFDCHNRDIFVILDLIFQKNQLNLSDRNLLRRILLSCFDENLIRSGGKKLVQNLKYVCLQKNEKLYLKQNQKYFYFIVSGSVQITSKFYKKTAKGRQYFGHIELLCQTSDSIHSIQAHKKSAFFTITQKYFQTHLKKYFLEISHSKELSIMLLEEEIFTKVHPISRRIFIDELSQRKYKAGQKITQQFHKFKLMHFLSLGQISQLQLNPLVKQYRCIGLAQLFNQSYTYQQTIYCIQQCVAYSIKPEKFKEIIGISCIQSFKQKITALKMIQDIFLGLQKKKQKKQQNVDSFMRMKMIKLSPNIRPLNQLMKKTQEFVTQFFFMPKSLHNSSKSSSIKLHSQHKQNKRKNIISKRIKTTLEYKMPLIKKQLQLQQLRNQSLKY